MKILITGNMGYVGPICYPELRRSFPGCEIIGFDSGFFAHCLTGADKLPEASIDRQVFGDLRRFPTDLLDGVDTVVHLGAISNDPMGSKFEAVTNAINDASSIELARAAKSRSVKHFVFASSCSMYGAAAQAPKTETDTINPLTAYAKSKVAMEQELEKLADETFTATALRFATACGMAPRLRLDLVLNDFVASAVATGNIEVLSDGSPWRPLIHVEDMASAIGWACDRSPANGGNFLAVNAGSDVWNYQVRDLAKEVQKLVNGTSLSINADAAPDKRSYKVNFDLFRELAPQSQPKISLEQAIKGLQVGLKKINFQDEAFRTSHFMRLKVLESHIEHGAIDADLNWQ